MKREGRRSEVRKMMGEEMETLKLTQQEGIATLSFNRPTAMNSLNPAMADELLAVTTALKADASVKIVILQGEGKCFMAGGDVHFFQQNLDNLAKHAKILLDKVQAIIINLQTMGKPILACVHGSAAGIGLSLVLAADLAIASIDTKFTLAYTKIGTTLDGGSTYMLPRLVGTKKAMQLALLSELFTAEEAKALGLVNWVVAEEDLPAQALQIAKQLAQGPSLAFAKTKDLINQSWQYNLREQLNRETDAFVTSTKTKDFAIGVNAFMQKVKPEFEGE